MFKKLSPREVEIAHAMLRGSTEQEIADSFGCMQGTVQTHIRHMYGKLDIHRRWQLFQLAIDAGVLKFTPKYEKGK